MSDRDPNLPYGEDNTAETVGNQAAPGGFGAPEIRAPEGMRFARGANLDEDPSSLEEESDSNLAARGYGVREASPVPGGQEAALYAFAADEDVQDLDEWGQPRQVDSMEPGRWDSEAADYARGPEGMPIQEPSTDFRSEAVPSEPPSSEEDRHHKPYLDPRTPLDKEMGLFEHLNELRRRLVNCAIAIALGMVLTWKFSLPLQEFFTHPFLDVLKNTGGQSISTNPTAFFAIYFQFSLVTSIILTMPFTLFQVWKFIEPALTLQERRYGIILVPFACVLFVLGTILGYFVSPVFYKFFMSFKPGDVQAYWDYYESMILHAKMLLVFGASFEVPVVVIILNKLGIINRNLLIEYWRHAVVLIFTVVAILTPSWDMLSLTACAAPACLLYFLSIWLIKWL